MKEFFKKHIKLTVFCVILLIAAVALRIVSNRMSEAREALLAAASQTETATVERRNLVESISATGKVVSVGSKSVTANVSGVEVQEVNVTVGDVVAQGDVICVLDATELETELADAQASLAVTLERNQVDAGASQRSLAEAEATRNIELERADQDVADAWNDYLLALTDLEEAEADYLSAQQTTAEKNGEYEYRQELLAQAESAMQSAQSGSGMSSQYESEFAAEKNNLVSYITTEGIACADGALDRIYLSGEELGSMGAVDLAADSSLLTAEQISALDGYLGTLKGLQTKYKESTGADASYQAAQAEYQSLQSEVTGWQTKYNTAKQSEESLKSAYETAVNTTQSKLDAYNQQVRSKEDTVRSNDSTVQTRQDSVTTSQLENSVAGASDRQQIRQYQKQIEACTVTAPAGGVITEVNVEPGDNYTGAVIVTIEDISGYEIEAEIDEYDIGKIKEGQAVVIRTNGTGEEELPGTVTEIAPRATTGTSEVTYTVTVSVDTDREDLKMDMTARLSIILESRENVMTVPYQAVQEAEDGSFYVEVAEDTATADNAEETDDTQADDPAGTADDVQADGPAGAQNTRRISVQKGIESDYYIQVISTELQEGMKVVVPNTDGEANTDIEALMQQAGPMGGF